MIKAIETMYKGYRFRSRLEARWAVLLDRIECPFVYEKEGFDLDGTRYLPDFWLPMDPTETMAKLHPGAGFWLEIKPTELTQQEQELLKKLTLATNHHAMAFAGTPWPGEFINYKFAQGRLCYAEKDECWPWGLLYVLECCPPARWMNPGEFIWEAFKAARSARFEFGEQPT